MIRIQGFSQGLSHDFFELLRMLYPSYMGDLDLLVKNCHDHLLVSFNGKERAYPIGPFKDDHACKLFIKRLLYQDLDQEGRIQSPFGILTGVRPVKLVLEELDYLTPGQVKEDLVHTYLMDPGMADLLVELGQVEKEAFKDFTNSSYSLYIHIPFCPSRCDYCSYPIIKASNQEGIKAYTRALVEEISAFKGIKQPPSSIYIGGGTPTSIGANNLEQILDKVEEIFPKSQEYTVEAGRPDTLTKPVFQVLADHQVSRLSINPQTMQDDTLRRLNRKHTVEQIYKSFQRARDLGFDINMDLILGLSGEKVEDFNDSLEKVQRLRPENITIHTLSLKNGSKLFERDETYRSSIFIQSSLKNSQTYLRAHGYKPYYLYRQKKILSNGYNLGFSLEGKSSIYNMAMMEEQESILGLGMSASSKFYYRDENRIEKVAQFKNLRDYLAQGHEKTKEKLYFKEDFQW